MPYINHFLQPDTVIPSPASLQSWNRYSYVGNNPINASDPSGHKCVGEVGECLKANGKAGAGFSGPDLPAPGNGAGSALRKQLEKKCDELRKQLDEQLAFCDNNLLANGCRPEALTIQSEPTVPNLDEFEFLTEFTSGTLQFIDYMSAYEDIINSMRPVYKQTKYFFGTGGLEAVIDATLYGLKDRSYTSLTPGQRIGRMAIVGGQSFLIDRLSDKAGVLGLPFGGKTGEIGVQYIVSNALSEYAMPTTTYWAFEFFNLGVPQDISSIR